MHQTYAATMSAGSGVVRRTRRISSRLLEQRSDHVNCGRGLLDTHEAAAVFDYTEAGIGDLRRPRLAADLTHDIVDHHHAGRADRMALRYQTARHVDRDSPTERRRAR